jgi:hypothetical protein
MRLPIAHGGGALIGQLGDGAFGFEFERVADELVLSADFVVKADMNCSTTRKVYKVPILFVVSTQPPIKTVRHTSHSWWRKTELVPGSSGGGLARLLPFRQHLTLRDSSAVSTYRQGPGRSGGGCSVASGFTSGTPRILLQTSGIDYGH